MPFFLFTTSPQNFSKWIPEANSVRPSAEKNCFRVANGISSGSDGVHS